MQRALNMYTNSSIAAQQCYAELSKRVAELEEKFKE